MGIGDMLGWIGRAVGPAATVSLVASRKPMWQSATETCLRVVGWLAAAGLVVAVGYGWTHSGEAAARLLLWSLGLLTAGMFIGFLFGLPRVTPGSDAPAPAGRGSGGGAGSVAGEVGGAAGVAGAVENVEGAPSGRAPRGPAARLEIADGLTKIIAGRGRVNLREAPSLLDRLASSIGCSAGDGARTFWGATAWPFGFMIHRGVGHCDHSFALAMTVFFPVVGLMLGYLTTRLFLQTALVTSDRMTRDAMNAPMPVPQLMRQYKQSEAMAQKIAAGRKLPAHGQDPDDATRGQFTALNAQYTTVAIADYLARVRKKDEVSQQMYDLAVARQAPKSWLAAQPGDGYIHVLATSVLADADVDDIPGLLRVAASARMKHVKFRVIQAFQKLLEAELVDVDEIPLIQSLLSAYVIDADGPLRSLIELVRSKLA